MEALLEWDASLFAWLNGAAHPALDVLMPWITQYKNFLIPLVVLWLVLFWRGSARDRVLLVGVLAALGLSNLVSSQILKPLVDRIRPCHAIEIATEFFSCKKSPSFPSSHAANIACVCTVLVWRWRRLAWLAVPLALVIGYSRIYVGLHYPLDVLGGYVVGVPLGLLSFVVIRKLSDRVFPPEPAESPPQG